MYIDLITKCVRSVRGKYRPDRYWQYSPSAAARVVLPRPKDRYFPRTDRTNEVNKIFIIWLQLFLKVTNKIYAVRTHDVTQYKDFMQSRLSNSTSLKDLREKRS